MLLLMLPFLAFCFHFWLICAWILGAFLTPMFLAGSFKKWLNIFDISHAAASIVSVALMLYTTYGDEGGEHVPVTPSKAHGYPHRIAGRNMHACTTFQRRRFFGTFVFMPLLRSSALTCPLLPVL